MGVNAFGETTISYRNYVKNPYRYNAECADWVPGIPDFQYLRARYCNPNEGKFINQDSLFGDKNVPITQNLYLYCGNNAVNLIDPSGHGPKCMTQAVAVVATTVVDAAVAVAMVVASTVVALTIIGVAVVAAVAIASTSNISNNMEEKEKTYKNFEKECETEKSITKDQEKQLKEQH